MKDEINLQAAIYDVLDGAGGARLSVSDVRARLGGAGISVDTSTVHKRMGNLVGADRVARHHNPDGILTYSALPGGARKRSPVTPPAPSSTRPDVPTGPASVVPESPAPPRTPAAAPPHAEHATAPETSINSACKNAIAGHSKPLNHSIADDAHELAVQLEAAAKEMVDDGTGGASLRLIIGCVATAHRLAALMAAGVRA